MLANQNASSQHQCEKNTHTYKKLTFALYSNG